MFVVKNGIYLRCLVPVAPDSSSYRVWFLKIRVYLGGPVAPICTINKTKSSSSCLQLELVLFYYLRPRNPRAVTRQPHENPPRPGHGLNTLGKSNVILISIHVNAAGNGTQWMNATGWSCYTCKGQTQSDTLANCLYQAATKNLPGKRIRTDYSDNDPDWEENFYLLRKTLCPAVLSENYFMDNKSDLEYLQSRAGKQAVIDTHVEGITEYLNLIQYIT